MLGNATNREGPALGLPAGLPIAAIHALHDDLTDGEHATPSPPPIHLLQLGDDLFYLGGLHECVHQTTTVLVGFGSGDQLHLRAARSAPHPYYARFLAGATQRETWAARDLDTRITPGGDSSVRMCGHSTEPNLTLRAKKCLARAVPAMRCLSDAPCSWGLAPTGRGPRPRSTAVPDRCRMRCVLECENPASSECFAAVADDGQAGSFAAASTRVHRESAASPAWQARVRGSWLPGGCPLSPGARIVVPRWQPDYVPRHPFTAKEFHTIIPSHSSDSFVRKERARAQLTIQRARVLLRHLRGTCLIPG